jgi:hypothetical protein
MATLFHSGWQVTGLDSNAYVAAKDGSPIYGSRVHFATNAGNKGSVFLADTDLTPANVGTMIDQKAALLDSIANLEAAPLVGEG